MIEAIINRKPLLNLTGNYGTRGLFLPEQVCVSSMVANKTGIVDAIVELVDRQDELIHNCDSYASYYNFKDDGRASIRLAKDIDERLL
jgi:hypothetical protein